MNFDWLSDTKNCAEKKVGICMHLSIKGAIMKTKNMLFVFLVTGLLASGIPLFGQSRATGLLPTPRGLQQASGQAVMSRLNAPDEGLPSRVDLAEGKILPRNQGPIGSCGAFSTAQTLTIMRRTREGLPISNRSWHSPSFLYNLIIKGGPDTGSTFYDNLELAKHTGIATAITFPYTTDYKLRPGTYAFLEAERYKISEWRWIQHDDIDTFRSFLAQGYPIMVMLSVYNEGTPTGSFHGVVATGYNDAEKTVTFINSYGDNWGIGGFGRISYDTISNGSLVKAAYIMVPAAQNPSAPNFPANVKASMGIYKDKVAIKWDAVPNALEYQVFRLDSVTPADPREEQYVSLGVTSGTTYEDLTVRQDHRYFYLVRTHTRNISSDLSFPVEGWSSANINVPPGPPPDFSVIRQGNTVLCKWDMVENADRYIVYSWRRSDWIKIGETASTSFTDVNPAREGSLIIYMVVAENRYGKSLPSNTSSVVFESDSIDNDKKPDDGETEKYRGIFYSFPADKFIQAEKVFLANFQKNTRRFEERFRQNQQKLIDYFGGR
jgi:hypothetical protein